MYRERRDKKEIISKNKPPISGTIYWVRSIYHLVKRPILKFLTKPELTEMNEFKEVKESYLKLAKEMDEF